MNSNLQIVFWNMYGLNSWAKCVPVRSVIFATPPCIMCLSKTKLELVSLAVVLEMLRATLQDFYFLPVDGTHGGILLAWL